MLRTRDVWSKLFALCFVFALMSILLQNGFAMSLCLISVLFYICMRCEIPHFTLILFLAGIALRLLCLSFVNPPPTSDFSALLDAARDLLAGNGTVPTTAYFYLWAYQTFFTIYEAFLLSIWNSVLFLQIVNAVLASTTICLLYRMAIGHVSKRAAQFFAICITLFPTALLLHTLLSNQIQSAFFFALGLWILTCADCKRLRFWRFPLAGICIQLGNLFRAEGIVILVAVSAYMVFHLLSTRKEAKKESPHQFLLGVVVLFVCYSVLGGAADIAVRRSGINPNGLSNEMPEWKLILGFNHETGGEYSEKDWSKLWPTLDENYYRTEETDRVIAQMLEERLSCSLPEMLSLLRNKIDNMWNQSPLHWFFSYRWDLTSKRYLFMCDFNQGLVYSAAALSIYGLCSKRKRFVQRNAASYLPFFVMFAAFCAFLLVEVQPRYGYMPLLFLFYAAAFGIDCLIGGRKNGS